jgi:hypothetical protein
MISGVNFGVMSKEPAKSGRTLSVSGHLLFGDGQ